MSVHQLTLLYMSVDVPPAQWFVQNIGEENSYMNSESDSD